MENNATVPAKVEELLQGMGAREFPHANGRSLYDHLLGTQTILRVWSQPDWVCNAGALHSIYGTEVYNRQLVSMTRRSEIQAAVGMRAERLVYSFGVVSRRNLLKRMHSVDRREGIDVECQGFEEDYRVERLSSEEASALLVLHMANTIEQCCSDDGSPGLCLAQLSQAGAVVKRVSSDIPPVFDYCRQTLKPDDEAAARDAYLSGLSAMLEDRSAAVDQMSGAIKRCPWVAEPAIWLAYLQLQEGGREEASINAEQARKTLLQWGTAWDKRLGYDQWCWLIDFIASQVTDGELGPLPSPGEPVDLPNFLYQLERRNWVEFYLGSGLDSEPEEAGASRFHRYVDSFAEPDLNSNMKVYPGLRTQPWHDPKDFPLAMALEAEYPAICREILALDRAKFVPEVEPIGRTGSWTVLFLRERGRRSEQVGAQCPVTSRVIESHRAINTLAGLCYISRLAPGTYVTPHCGPTNLRVRCHLGIQVPMGNCGIRVDSQTRQWTEGKCIVFDDFLFHEVWNHTAEDRLVLIVDLWHPDLTDEEISLLEGLHQYAAAQASSLNSYWAENEKARLRTDERGSTS